MRNKKVDLTSIRPQSAGFRIPSFVFRFSVLLFAVHFSLSSVQAQNPDACEMPGNKKVNKLWEQAKVERKPSVRKELCDKIIDLEPDHHGAIFLKTFSQLKRAERDPRAKLGWAKNKLEAVASLCPEYHPYTFFYLGKLSMGEKEMTKAIGYFKQFFELEYADDRMYPKDYTEKWDEAEALMKNAEYYKDIYEKPVPFEPTVVEGVSSKKNEYLAIISPDDVYCLYIRSLQRKGKNDLTPRQVEEFTRSKRQADGKFHGGKPMPKPFNLSENVGSATLTVDNRKMYLTICEVDAQGYKNCDIFMSFKNRYDMWSEPINLGPGVNNKNSFEGQPTVTPDGKTLYFVSIREDSIGSIDNMDLYVSQKGEDGKWGKAVNLGRKINTDGNEKSPFIHEDSHTLYFSSDGHLGVGQFDIYYVRQDSTGNWTEPKNIGYPINTELDDVGFFVSTDGKTGFFNSNERDDGMGGWDLFSFPLYKEARPEKVLFMKGQLLDDKNKPVTDAKIEFRNIETKEVTQVEVDSLTGRYVAVVNFEQDMIMSVDKKGSGFNTRYLSTEDTALEKIVTEDVEVKEMKVGSTHRLHNINFDSDSFDLNARSKALLVEFVRFLKENKKLKVGIHGHTDSTGDDGKNMTLSKNRAREVYRFLVDGGIPASRLSHNGYGETKPVGDNSTKDGRAKNRRTEFVILSK